METQSSGEKMRKTLLVINCILLAVGTCGGPLILRLYFVKGGQSVWLSTWLQTAGFPIIFVPLTIAYFHRLKAEGRRNARLIFLTEYRIFAAAAFIGVLLGVGNYFYGYGIGRLPVTTSSIITASQLAFIAVFAFFIVQQRFNALSVNAVVLLTVGPVVLGLRESSDRPAGESNQLYVLGFVMTILADLTTGLVMPLVELLYKKARQQVTYTFVMEIQLVICFFATVFSTVGMLANRDFQAMPIEARGFELGEAKYYLVVFWNAVILQCFFVGFFGVISCTSSFVAGIIIAVCLPFTEVLAVFFFDEKFPAEKGVALFLSLWGFASYFYGEFKQNKEHNVADKEEISHQSEATDTIEPMDAP